jgi:hypothetical protein
MRGNGINYDTGFLPGGKASRPHFDARTARRELEVIAKDLHCDTVRITGGDLNRLRSASEHAAGAGLAVWLSPFPTEMTRDELLPYFSQCAAIAETLRREGASVVLVTGCELSVFASGFLPGRDAYKRMAALSSPDPALLSALADVPTRFNSFLGEVATTVRARFGGLVTYAAAAWEPVDWTPFDIVSVDAYRDAQNAAGYADQLRQNLSNHKPLAVTEFGCCTYRGAGDRGGMGWAIVDESTDPPHIRGEFIRDESEQVRYMRDLIPLFDEVGADVAFWFTFAGYRLAHRLDPRHDLDMASFGVVKMLNDQEWEPKESFFSLADLNARSSV